MEFMTSRFRIRFVAAFVFVAMIAGLFAAAGSVEAASEAAATQKTDQKAAAETTEPTTQFKLPRKPVTEKSFQKSWPAPLDAACCSSGTKVRLQWREVHGAEKYQVYRSESAKGKYKLFAETKLPELKKKADGEFFYKIRAVRGDLVSRWSRTLHIYSVGGYIEKVRHDENGFTSFTVRVSNYTDRPIYFYGTELYDNARHPRYQIEKYNLATTQKQGYPYPRTALLRAPVNGTICVPADTEEQKIEIWIPASLPLLGETGIEDEEYAYRLRLQFSVDTAAALYTTSLSGNKGGARTRAILPR